MAMTPGISSISTSTLEIVLGIPTPQVEHVFSELASEFVRQGAVERRSVSRVEEHAGSVYPILCTCSQSRERELGGMADAVGMRRPMIVQGRLPGCKKLVKQQVACFELDSGHTFINHEEY